MNSYWCPRSTLIAACLVGAFPPTLLASQDEAKNWKNDCGAATSHIARFKVDHDTGHGAARPEPADAIELVLLLEGDTTKLVYVGSMLITGGCLPQLEDVAKILYARYRSLDGIRYVRAIYRFLGDEKSNGVYPNTDKYRANAPTSLYAWQLVEQALAPTPKTEVRAYSLTHRLTDQQKVKAAQLMNRIVAEIADLSSGQNR